MSIQTQIDRISGNVTAALSAIGEKGVTVPDGSNSNNLAELIAQISSGGMELPGFVSEINFGTFTKAYSVSSVKVAHGLSGKPKGFAVWASSSSKQDKLNAVFGINMSYYNYSTGGGFSGAIFFLKSPNISYQNTCDSDETYFYLYTSTYNFSVYSGVAYNWIAWR